MGCPGSNVVLDVSVPDLCILSLRNESKIILCFNRLPKNCCLAHMRRKLFNIGGGEPSMPISILVEGYCKNVHTSMHAHTHQCTYKNTCTCS